MLSDEQVQRHLRRVRKIAEEKGEPIGFTFRERSIIDPRTGELWNLKTFPWMLQALVRIHGEVHTIEIPTTCYVVKRYQGRSQGPY